MTGVWIAGAIVAWCLVAVSVLLWLTVAPDAINGVIGGGIAAALWTLLTLPLGRLTK